jgi:hypothetical protein
VGVQAARDRIFGWTELRRVRTTSSSDQLRRPTSSLRSSNLRSLASLRSLRPGPAFGIREEPDESRGRHYLTRGSPESAAAAYLGGNCLELGEVAGLDQRRRAPAGSRVLTVRADGATPPAS